MSPVAYGTAVGTAALVGVALCVLARLRPGRWEIVVARCIGLVLVADSVSYVAALIVHGSFSFRTSLPFALCNMAVVAAAAACWWRIGVLVELTYFWGLAGTLQAIATPDLNAAFPHLVFFQYVVGHLGIVLAALFLVVGLGHGPRSGAVVRTLVITVAYTAFVGAVDASTGADYMFLRRPPANWTLLRLLGPWPWYILSAAGVAVALVVLLDMPFRSGRTHAVGRRSGASSRQGIPAPRHLEGPAPTRETVR